MENMTEKDIYDIIIEKVMEESMVTNLPNNKWEVPQYSKAEINNAGKVITKAGTSFDELESAINILNNWRASHAYPLQVMASNLRTSNPNAIVVQRLKRLESILGKLDRFSDMSLYRMQDLGGCRVIVDRIEDVYESLNKYKNSRIRHILKREYDYIQDPKPSGYRSYHMVYQFHSDKKDTYNKNMLIEIQFRTKLQHIWATAVEMMGIYTKSNLKSSQGNEEVLRFFTLVSSVFAKMENMPICPNTPDVYDDLVREIKVIDEKNNITSCLSALSVAIQHVNNRIKDKKYKYYILLLDYEKMKLRIKPFESNQIELATKAYNEIESKKNKDKMDVVLVSASSFDSLKAAYPNYFIDISEFVGMMRRILA